MKIRMRMLLATLVALSLLTAGLAFAEEGLQLDAGTAEAVGELPEPALEDGALAVDGAALVSEDVEANTEGDEIVAKINKTNFPAKDFRNYVLKNIDANGDKKLSRSEAEAVEEIHLRSEEDTQDRKSVV